MCVHAGYSWSDGTPLSHTNWGHGEPNDHDGREECVEMVSTTNGTYSWWNDLNCDAHQDWICRITKGKDPILPPVPPSPVPGKHSPARALVYAINNSTMTTSPLHTIQTLLLPFSPPSAPDCGTNPGWRKKDGICYYYNDTDPVDFHTAMIRCYHEKALLASIHSTDEQAFVNSMVRHRPILIMLIPMGLFPIYIDT